MKRILKTIVILIIFLSLTQTCFSETNEEISKNIIENIPDSASEILNDVEINPSYPENLSKKLDFNNIVLIIWNTIKKLFNENYKSLSIIIFLILLSAILKCFFNQDKNIDNYYLAQMIFGCMTVLFLFSAIQNVSSGINEAVESMTVFIKSCTASMTMIILNSGSPFASALFSYMVALGCDITSTICSYFLIPIINIFVGIGVCQSFSSEYDFSIITNLFKKIVKWFLIGYFSIFSIVLSFQSFLAGSADSIAKKAIKVTLSSSVPVVGGSISEGVDGVFTLAKGVKNSVSIVSVLVILAIFLSPLILCLVNSMMISISQHFSEFLGDKKIAGVLKIIKDAFMMLFSVGATCVFISIVSFLILALNIFGG